MAAHLAYTCFAVFVSLGLILPGDPPSQEESEKEAAMEKIQSLLGEEDWKKAVKSIKAYRRKHASGDDEKKKIDHLLGQAESEQELEDIDKEYRKRKRVRQTVGRLSKFLEGRAKFPDLTKRAEELIDTLRSQYVAVLDDFEGEKPITLILNSRKIFLVEDPKLVRQGKKSARWKSRAGSGGFSLFTLGNTDWSEYSFFCAWIFNEKKGSRPATVRISPMMEDFEHYFECNLAIDWLGWKEVRLPLSGRGSRFSKHGKPDWGAVRSVIVSNESGVPIELIFDDIRLEKAVR